MKVAAWFFLFVFLGGPFFVALWYFFPIVVGLAGWLLYRFWDNKVVSKFLKPIVGTILLAFLVWLFFIPKLHPPAKSYETSGAGQLLAKLLGSQKQSGIDAGQPGRTERQRFSNAVARQRLKLAKISSAFDLYNSGDAVFVNRNRRGLDTSTLGAALGDFRKALTPHKGEDGSTTPDLFDPENVKAVVKAAEDALHKIEAEVDQVDLKPDQITAKLNQIPGIVKPYQIDALYGEVAKVENALQQTLRSEVATRSGYYVVFDRSSDTLMNEQRTTIQLGKQQATAIDVRSFFWNEPQGSLELWLQEDSSEARRVEIQAAAQVPLHPETKQLLIVRRFRKQGASSPLMSERLWIRFRAVDVHWYLPLDAMAVLTIRYPEDASVTWPLSVDITTAASTPLQGIRIPRNSFYFADTALKPSTTTVGDELAPEESAPKVADLATDKSVRVEILPWYLSNSVGQKYKEYLAIENLVAALVVAIGTSLVLALISAKD